MTEDRHDLRMPIVGAAAWVAGIAAYHAGDVVVPAIAAGGLLAPLLLRWLRPTPATRRLVAAAAMVALAVATSTLLRHHGTTQSPVVDLARERAEVSVRASVAADPRLVAGQWGDRMVVPLRVHALETDHRAYRLGASVVALADEEWAAVRLGEELTVTGRLLPAEEPDTAAMLTVRGPPGHRQPPDAWWRGAEAVRASLRASVRSQSADRRGLVPALVVGDVSALRPALEADFRTTGLTHLTAVSGTNLTLLLGFVLLLARSAGVRGRSLRVVALLGIVGFILLTRTEPSVLRAAAMGLVGLFALGTDGRRRGMRALGVAVAGLLLAWPPLAVSVGFALSVLATGGIVVAGPPITRALATWLPVPLAQAVAVPLAAQAAVTPVIAGISGEVSLVAVVANLLVAPAVGPATVLGLAGGLAGLVWPAAGGLCGWAAGWCVAWIVTIAEWGAGLPRAAVGWGTGAPAVAALVVLCVALLWLAPRLVRRPRLALVLTLVVSLAVLDLPGRAGSWWPGGGSPDWSVVACDVGQGDALVVRTAPGAAVVVDVGPDPSAVAGCLDRLAVQEVPLVVLTHFHADHVDGLTGVLRGRRVGAIAVSPVRQPAAAAARVDDVAAEHATPVGEAAYGDTRRYGAATVQVVGPAPGTTAGANDASVVVLVEVDGLRVLLTGDVEPPAQQRLAARLPDLQVDVLKVPHHGSRQQDVEWLASLRAEVALVPVGADNDYGHPDADLLAGLAEGGTRVARTDRDGDVAVVAEGGEPRLVPAG
ncbi:ComEC/Rec2 family competence protein [Nocardioides panacisoli]|uniref:ComEC/Rec2 family competence protein n=1 Tax=Nocardioides panacisoli TaxID=627624 RepID=UPI001C6297F7|nr:ComEC/Rec2 family competence protein [Nocardioides panacisoli]QYJ04639.1 ComEC/Rec2 family competence protein [Nocardioides panacisoli]